jgi:N-acetylated-alpha-linked acidic dipeptidase
VHLTVSSNWDQKPLYDVIAKIPGSERPDEWVLRGNHHDAWVNGAEDPVSGLVAELEEARALGDLVKQGWKPKRTLIYCAWDGEEPGLLGSTEWVEAHAAELVQHAVAYINSDTNGRGYLGVEGSHVLEKFVNSIAHDITDPEKNMSVWQRWKDHDIATAHDDEDRGKIRDRTDLRIGALGDGSDYTAFIHHLGIPSLDVSYHGETHGGIYHSIYDDFYWYSHFGDPKFAYSRTQAQTVGSAVLRLADADLLPFDYTDFADTVKTYLENVQKVLESHQDSIRERNRELEDGIFAATSDPLHPLFPPHFELVPPHFNFAPLENAVDALSESADRLSKAIGQVESNGLELSPGTTARLNTLMMRSGPALTDSAGLPHRPWFQNMIYAPGAYTGYEAKPLPGVLEALDRKDWAEAESQIPREAEALERERKLIDEMAAALNSGASSSTESGRQ